MTKKNPVCVHKFGGSSLANAERLMSVKSLLKGNEIVVVSAVQGTTSTLQAMMDEAKSSLKYRNTLKKLEDKHVALIVELSLEAKRHDLIERIKSDIHTIQDILYAIYLTGCYSKETQHLILGYGELWSALILNAYLGQDQDVAFLDASTVLFIYEKEGLISIDWNKSKQALTHYLENQSFKQLVITGFIASTLDGQRTTLGRNGSDFSAAIFANLFNAESLTIWTDVDGIYTADPNLVRSTFVIESLSYQEALELAYFGAKVLHPMTIAPVVEKHIPIYIKNSFNPEKSGTCISAHPKQSSQLIKGITCIDKIGLINIEGSGLITVSGIVSRVFNILHHAEINVLFISQASSEYSICLAVPAPFLHKARDVLLERFERDIEQKYIKTICADPDCAIVSIVGDKMTGAIGVSSQLFAGLAKANINVHAISQGSSERNISVVIKNKDVKKAIQAVHSGFYLSRKTLSIGIIGPGRVGQSLLAQLNQTMASLSETYQINLQVRGIMNSRQMLLQEAPIDLSDWEADFKTEAIQANIEQFMEHIASNTIPNAVIIDCTASPGIAQLYERFMQKGIHVITPNKHANAGRLDYYKTLQALAKRNNYYFYEATVCAGLPVISTLQDLVKTGDKIEGIEGVFSGTLSFIFNELGKGKKFSEAVLQAKQLGFTEPDPREDLSGMDVARKLVCLAREVGYDVDLSDVRVHDLVPAALKSCSIAEFLSGLSQYDHTIQNGLDTAELNRQRLHYVGTISDSGQLHVAIKTLPESHPFSRLEGTDNMIIFRTERYKVRPLIIQGPGAGAEVTAAGIFSDLLRLVSVL